MAAIAGIPPKTLKELLEANGWVVIDETDHNWLLADGQQGEPVIIPKHGDTVTPDVMESVAHRSGLSSAIHRAVRDHLSVNP